MLSSIEKSKWRRIALTCVAVAIVASVAANSLNYVTPLRAGPDAGEYAAGSMMLKEGRVLYKEISEDKPPVMWFLNALAFSWSGVSLHSIRLLERLVAIASALLFFSIACQTFRSQLLAILGSLGYCLYVYHPDTFEEGNVSEEYALLFVLAGILAATREGVRPSRAYLVHALSGLFFACAVLTKEPFIFSSVPWFFYILLRRGGGWRPALHRGLSFVCGALVPVALFFVYLSLNGAVEAWIDMLSWKTGSFRVQQIAPSSALERLSSLVLLATSSGLIAAGLGLFGGLAVRSFVVRYRYVPLVLVAACAADYVGAIAGTNLFGHYFLQMMPSFVLTCVAGGALLLDALGRALSSKRKAGCLLAAVVLVLDFPVIGEFWKRLREPFVRSEIGEISKFIREHAAPSDHLWVTSLQNSRFYVETGLISPIKYQVAYPLFFRDTWKTTREEKLAFLEARLREEAPVWIVASALEGEPLAFLEAYTILGENSVMDWLCDNYSWRPIQDAGHHNLPAFLYVRNDRAQNLPPAEPTPDPLCPPPRQPEPTSQRPVSSTSAAGLIARSTEHASRSEYNEGIALCEAALETLERKGQSDADRNRLAAMAHNNICFFRAKQADWSEAVEACRAALALDPGLELASNNLRWVEEMLRVEVQ